MLWPEALTLAHTSSRPNNLLSIVLKMYYYHALQVVVPQPVQLQNFIAWTPTLLGH